MGRRLQALRTRAHGWVATFWDGPEGLPGALLLEWRILCIRWCSFASLLPCFVTLDLGSTQRTAVYAILLLFVGYNLLLTRLINRRPELVVSGYPTSLGDAALITSMIVAVGGFDSAFAVWCFPLVMSVAMRFRLRVSICATVIIIVADALSRSIDAAPLDVTFAFRNLALLSTVMLASFLRERAERAYAEMAATADENARLYVSAREELAERMALEARLAHQAFHDPLTGLPNRALFLDRTGHALVRARRGGQPCAVLFLDLDNFKVVNDTLGHDAGDRLLGAVTARLRGCLREEDTLARLGGDEFTVLLDEVPDASEAAEVADRLGRALALPLPLDGREHHLAASIGIAVSTMEHARADDLLRDADIAMYRAKGSGKGGYAIFDPAMQAQLARRVELERDLRGALERGEFTLQYQPIVDLATGRVTEAEALLRWHHPVRGNVFPDSFIAVAEEIGLIIPLGRWVLGEACRRARSWEDRGHAITVAVNLAAPEFQQPDLIGNVTAALAEAGIAPGKLRLEITERLAMRDAPATAATLAALRELGVQVAIDDFGTGYSSLAYLKQFPVDVLKIDRTFVAGLKETAQDAAIVGAMVGLGRTLELAVTAEGVETAEQAAHLRTLGCSSAQGYFFSPPLNAAALDELIDAGGPMAPPSHDLSLPRLAPGARGRALITVGTTERTAS